MRKPPVGRRSNSAAREFHHRLLAGVVVSAHLLDPFEQNSTTMIQSLRCFGAENTRTCRRRQCSREIVQQDSLRVAFFLGG